MKELTNEARCELIAAAVASVPKDAERRQLRWRGEDISFPVVKVHVDSVLLNPDSHRIKAQTRSLRPEERKDLEDDPFSVASQGKIAEIIRSTRGYPTVKAAIARDKQQDPGVMTHAGVLVNANTRAVALRDLRTELSHDDAKALDYIKVHVLPEDAQTDEIVKLELGFQMRPNVQQDYTFTNRLLFIQDLFEDGLSPEQIGLEMNRALDPESVKDRAQAARDIETEDRMRQMIQELIDASDGALAWGDFDDERQNLIDIDSAFQAVSNKKGADAARRVRQAKLAGMLAGLDYRKVRLIDESYLDEYVVAAMEEDPNLKASARALAMGGARTRDDDAADLDPLAGLDLDNFDDPDSDSETVTLEPLFDLLVKTGKSGKEPERGATISFPTEDGETELAKDAFFTSVFNAMAVAATAKERDSQGQDTLDVPRRQLAAAATACDKARRTLHEILDGGQDVDRTRLRSQYEAYLRSNDELVGYLESKLDFASEADTSS